MMSQKPMAYIQYGNFFEQMFLIYFFFKKTNVTLYYSFDHMFAIYWHSNAYLIQNPRYTIKFRWGGLTKLM